MTLVDRYYDRLLDDLDAGLSLADAMRELTIAHADHLRELGPVGVLTLDPCPRCGGRVVAGEQIARCAAGCDWRSA